MVKTLTSATLFMPETAPKVTPQERPKADTKRIPEDPLISQKKSRKKTMQEKKQPQDTIQQQTKLQTSFPF